MKREGEDHARFCMHKAVERHEDTLKDVSSNEECWPGGRQMDQSRDGM